MMMMMMMMMMRLTVESHVALSIALIRPCQCLRNAYNTKMYNNIVNICNNKINIKINTNTDVFVFVTYCSLHSTFLHSWD